MPNTPDKPRDYRIAPRYLANADADGSEVVQPLLDAGWAPSRDEEGNTFVVSPDLRARLAHLPESDGRVLWKVSAGPDAFAPPQWLVTFDNQTPPEVVADFTTAVADAYSHSPGAYLNGDGRSVGVETCLGLLADEWSLNPATPFLTYQSPDRFVRLHVRDKPLQHEAEMGGNTERWLFEAGVPGQVWYATASSRLPERLLQALTTAVADPATVERSMRRIDLAALPAVATATPTVPSPLEVARIRAATARSTFSPSPPAACGLTAACAPRRERRHNSPKESALSKPVPGQPLTPAEATLLRYLTEGYTIAEVARRQGSRAATVHSRAARARRKLGANTLDHAVQLYVEQQAAKAATRHPLPPSRPRWRKPCPTSPPSTTPRP